MVTITIETDNEAFSDPVPEIARLLRYTANFIESMDTQPSLKHDQDIKLGLYDSNGNRVGEYHYSPEEE